jgi:dephospho-CoA kinase
VALEGLPVLGLLGGASSGKSLVARQFAQLGAYVLDGDRAGHEVLREPEVEQAARRRWGEAIFGPDGRIDRAALAAIVFAPAPDGPRELRYLEELTHPRIAERLREEAAAASARSDVPALVLDAAVMLKAGWDQFCDAIVFVDAPREVRRARAAQRGWDARQFAAREAAQEPVEEKRRRATHVVDNSGTPEAARAQVVRIWAQYVARPAE